MDSLYSNDVNEQQNFYENDNDQIDDDDEQVVSRNQTVNQDDLEQQQIQEQQKEEVDIKNEKTTNIYQQFMKNDINLKEMSFKKDMHFMMLDIDQYKIVKNFYTQQIVRLFCINESGNSIILHINNYIPYFYVEVPEEIKMTEQNIKKLIEHINQNEAKVIKQLRKIELEEKESLRRFKGKNYHRHQYLKIYVDTIEILKIVKNKFQSGVPINTDPENNNQTKIVQFVPYEFNIPYTLKFMIDKEIQGMGWLKVNANSVIKSYQYLDELFQIHLEIDQENIKGVPLEGNFSQIPPLRILSIFIEHATEIDIEPDPKERKILTICSILKLSNSQQEIGRIAFTLNQSCLNLPYTIVKTFKTEKEMLLEWQNFVKLCDPDFFLGYEIVDLHLRYIFERAIYLNIKEFGYLSRIKNQQCQLLSTQYKSKVMNFRQTYQLENFSGRVCIDILKIIISEQKIQNYTLSNISLTLLDIPICQLSRSDIIKLFNSKNVQQRTRIPTQCLKCCDIMLQLIEKFMYIYKFTEMARVTGVSLKLLFQRGQQIKVLSQVLRKIKSLGYVIPTSKSFRFSDGAMFEGGAVKEPKPFYYNQPIASLDYSSLYPSIMISFNLCYSTQILNPQILCKLDKSEYFKTPVGYYFVKPSVQKGILPQILEDLIEARKKVKQLLEKEQDPVIRMVLDSRQLAIKVSANSIYGITGAQFGDLSNIEIASSVTAYGRELIKATQEEVVKLYQTCEVIYSDTDSVLINFLENNIEEVIKKAKEASSQLTTIINQRFESQCKLIFEKVYFPFLIESKKRYAGLIWSKADKYDKIDVRGIEIIKRDSCSLTREMMMNILEYIMIDKNIDKAIQYIQNTVNDLYQNKIELNKLIISKSIQKDLNNQDEDSKKSTPQQSQQYKVELSHVTLAKQLKKQVKIGDRIPYVIIAGVKNSRNYENARDPLQCLQENMVLDYQYYIDKQMKTPLQKIIELVANKKQLEQFNSSFKPLIIKEKSSQIKKFFQVQKTCIFCRKEAQSNKIICLWCEPKLSDNLITLTNRFNILQSQFADISYQCKECQQCNLFQDSLNCINIDCPVIYQKKIVMTDIEEVGSILNKCQQLNVGEKK